jgi:hypothetical protein
MTIASNDTADNPIISPNWLLDPRDLQASELGVHHQGYEACDYRW